MREKPETWRALVRRSRKPRRAKAEEEAMGKEARTGRPGKGEARVRFLYKA